MPVPFDYYSLSGLPAGYLSSSAEDLAHYLIAQMNGGRFGSATVLSPTGIATMHAPGAAGARGGSYGMGWVNGQLGGVPAIFHDGDEVNFHTLLLIEPETHWGAILLVNANSAMPIGSGDSPLPLQSLQDGVARLLSGQAPQASLGLTTFYLIFDGVLAVLLALTIFPLLRLRRWSRRFGQRRHRVVRLGLRLTWEVALPVALLLGFTLFASMVGVTNWYEILLLWPDVGSWVLAICALLLLTGVIRAVLAIRVLRRTAAETSAVKPSPSPSLT